MAGTVTINTPSWAAGLQSASNTAETAMRLENQNAESGARVGALEARTRYTEEQIHQAQEVVEAQQFENAVRVDERQRYEAQRDAEVQFDIDRGNMGGVETVEQPGWVDDHMGDLSPEVRGVAQGLLEEGERRDVQTENQRLLMEQVEDILDDTEAPLRDSSKQELWDLAQQLGEWDAANPEVGVSPDEVQARLEALYKRDGAFIAGREQRALDVESLRTVYTIPGQGMSDHLAAAIAHRMAGGSQTEANEMAMRGHPVYGAVLEENENRAFAQAQEEQRFAFGQHALDKFLAEGGDINNPDEVQAFLAGANQFVAGGAPSSAVDDNAVPPPTREVADAWAKLVPKAEAQRLHAQGVTPEQYAASQSGPLNPTPEQTEALPTTNKPKDVPAGEYKGILTRAAGGPAGRPHDVDARPREHGAAAQDAFLRQGRQDQGRQVRLRGVARGRGRPPRGRSGVWHRAGARGPTRGQGHRPRAGHPRAVRAALHRPAAGRLAAAGRALRGSEGPQPRRPPGRVVQAQAPDP